MEPPEKIRGRGAGTNPANRFEKWEYVPDALDPAPPDSGPRTEFYRDRSRSILTRNDSPDVGFSVSLNPYRGCEHGCIYCYARPTHEYLGYSAGLDFESRILIKEDAPELLRRELGSRHWTPQVVSLSGVTDAYQPVERRLGLTRRCLEVFAEFRNPIAIVTKNHLVTRDADILEAMAGDHTAAVYVSLPTLDEDLAAVLEPRASRPRRRVEAIRELSARGIPVGVLIAPVIVGLTDHEMITILRTAHEAGARFAGFVPIRLPLGVAPLFEKWLETHRPDRKAKVLGRIRSLRGGKLNDPRFGNRMRGEGIFAEQLRQMFRLTCRRIGIASRAPELSTAHFRRPQGDQLCLPV